MAKIEWRVASGLTPYPDAVAAMEAHVAAMAEGRAGGRVWLVEHPPLYSAGTSAKAGDLLWPNRFPVYETGRGGQYTYHGPGQRVAYVMLDLARRGGDLRAYVRNLEDWIMATLAQFDIRGERRADRIGIWVAGPDGREDKIAALGVRIRRGMTYHGIAINLAPDLSHFAGIVPCGIAQGPQSSYGVTSLAALGLGTDMAALDRALLRAFEPIFGPTDQSSPS